MRRFSVHKKPLFSVKKPLLDPQKAVAGNTIFATFCQRLASTRNTGVAEIFASTRANLVNRIRCIFRISYIAVVKLLQLSEPGVVASENS